MANINIYPVKTPKIFSFVFKNRVWNIPINERPDNRSDKEIYLTFDDGPIPEITPWVLDTLFSFNAKATFFCIGKNIEKHPGIFKQIIDQKHKIANHTYEHSNGWKTSNKNYRDSILKTERIIKLGLNKNDSEGKLFRPPYGKISPVQARFLVKNGYKIIMWDVLSGDFDQYLSKESCYQNVVKNAINGSIVVFHDSEKAFKNLQYTLPKILKFFSEKGFVFKVI